jgi:branched-chain amino acid transport system ATP-binding protein
MTGGEALSVTDLDAMYGPAQALFGVSFSIHPQEIVGIIGRNGAGKTTLVRSIARVHKKVSGSITFDGRELTGLAPDVVARLGVSHVREGGKSFLGMSVRDNLDLALRLARRRGVRSADLAQVWDWFPFLKDRQEEKVAFLSGGQRQAMALSAALLSQPKLLLLDEPSAGLAPSVARDFFASLTRLRERDVTVIVVEQNPLWLAGLVDRTLLLESGTLGGVGNDAEAPNAGVAT